MYKVAFATDQHILLENENPFGIDTKTNFQKILSVIKERQYNALILGGDLCFLNGDEPTYLWFYSELNALSIPYYIIPGNHDDPILITRTWNNFPINKQNELFYQKNLGGIPMCFLDTSKGYMEEDQYIWLFEKINQSPDDKVWISMHHPPVFSGSKHMDEQYAFQQIEKFTQVCQNFPDKTFFVFSGHCHLERTIHYKNLVVNITPSSYINIDPEQSEFTPLIYQKSGYREMCWDGNSFFTNVLYVD